MNYGLRATDSGPRTMKPSRLEVALIGMIVLLGGAALAFSAGLLPGKVAPRPGFAAPDFSLPLLDGGSVRLSSLRGRPVVLNFWATWCPPCQEEMPHLQAAAAAAGERAVFLGVDDAEPAADVRAFLQSHGVTYPIALDTGATADLYGAYSLPVTFFIDKDGVVRDVIDGAVSPAVLEDRLRALGAAP